MQNTQSLLTRKKAVFIDGASAHHTKGALGIRFFNCCGLFDVMVNCVGTSRYTAFPPLVTMKPDVAHYHEGLAKDFSGAGFEIIPITTQGGADDEAIKNRIRLLNPSEVCEIVILTSDKDFIPILRQKVQEGIVVYWVSTNRHRPGEKCSGLSSEVIALCRANVFHFVELATFSGKIMEKKLTPNASVPERTRNDDFTRATVKLRNTNPQEHLRLANELRRLEHTFVGLTVAIDE